MSTDPVAPTLSDGVVTLRAHRPDDAQGVWEQCQDPLSQEWTTVPVPYPMEYAVGYVEREIPAGWSNDHAWAFALDVDGQYGGTLELRNEGHGRAEIAYGSHPAVRGTGAVERGLRLLVEWGFAARGLHTLIWWADRGNWASRRTAWRLGFAVEGAVRQWLNHRGELRDAWVGTLLRDDPREPRSTWLADPVVEGDGVRLRPLADDDLPRLVEALGDPQTQHWLALAPRDPGPADGRVYLETVTERLATAHTLTWAFADQSDDRLLGTIGLYRLQPEPELGYLTHPDARRRGLTTRAGALVLDHGFGALGLDRVAAYASVPNVGSRRVLDALGFTGTGVRRSLARTGDGAMTDLAGYDLLASEWRSWRAESASTPNPRSESSTPTSSGDR